MIIITYNQMAGGVAQYTPYIFFDSRELYYPSSIDYYTANLLIPTSSTDSDPASLSTLLDYKHGFDTEDDLKHVPLYVGMKTDDSTNTIQYTYVIFFPHLVETYICGCIPWSLAPQSRKISVRVDLKTNTILGLTVDETNFSGTDLEIFDSHPVLYYFEGTFSIRPQSVCCNCYGHDQCGYLFKPKLFYPLE